MREREILTEIWKDRDKRKYIKRNKRAKKKLNFHLIF